jgi:hypothetical protein
MVLSDQSAGQRRLLSLQQSAAVGGDVGELPWLREQNRLERQERAAASQAQDRTRVLRWGLWPTWALVAIDHFSRAVMAGLALEGPNAGWVVGAMEEAFRRHGPPPRSPPTDSRPDFLC